MNDASPVAVMLTTGSAERRARLHRLLKNSCFVSGHDFRGCGKTQESPEGTSMIGKSQRETEVPHDPVEFVLRASGELEFGVVHDSLVGPARRQRGQTSICGNDVETPSTKIELG
jgi:hypothetical protein